jgi:hypothetical protein
LSSREEEEEEKEEEEQREKDSLPICLPHPLKR